MKRLLYLLFLLSQAVTLYGQEQGQGLPAAEPNVIRWGTASEHGNFGYDVYRGPTENGPFTLVNDEPVQGAGTTDMPQRYEYLDKTILAETIYWYYVESISLNGDRKRITPIYASRPKSSATTDG